ncbi:MAG: hypothetical protein C0603_07040 [Denitrovibrio sp.]|nr:MAG: hypothetical protein C0603_07040 [Denitrovibrio sp.]
MGDFRRYACEISGELFKSINKKGIRREKLACELSISVNQLKNYAYDSSKSATLENFLHVLIKYKNIDVLNLIARDMGCCVSRLPDYNSKNTTTDVAAEVLAETAKAVTAYMNKAKPKEEISKQIRSSIEKLLYLESSL